MPEFLALRGSNALSDFRLDKLLSDFKRIAPAVRGISAEYWHFVKLRQPLTAEPLAILEKILTYGPAAGEVDAGGKLLLVVPRLGTISSWASKATGVDDSFG